MTEMELERRVRWIVYTSASDAKTSIDCWLRDPATYGGLGQIERIIRAALDRARSKTFRRVYEAALRRIERSRSQAGPKRTEGML